MTKKTKPCCQDSSVSMTEMIKIIKDKKFDDNDIRTCFWVYMDSQNGDKSEKKKKEVVQILETIKTHRPKAHEILLNNALKVVSS